VKGKVLIKQVYVPKKRCPLPLHEKLILPLLRVYRGQTGSFWKKLSYGVVGLKMKKICQPSLV
jgi:hypothetical protein